MKLSSPLLGKIINAMNSLSYKKHCLCNADIILYLEKCIIENKITSILDIGSNNLSNLKSILDKNKEIKYIGCKTLVDPGGKTLVDPSGNPLGKPDIVKLVNVHSVDLIIIKDYIEYLSEENIRVLFNQLKQVPNSKIIILTKKLSFNIDAGDGLYRPVNLNCSPYNMNLTVEKEYYYKENVLVYSIFITVFSTLAWTKGYKLYYVLLIILILLGLFSFPKYIILKL